jgi:hypothetical protein
MSMICFTSEDQPGRSRSATSSRGKRRSSREGAGWYGVRDAAGEALQRLETPLPQHALVADSSTMQPFATTL